MARDLPSSVIMKLYLCYLRPSLEYASPCWHGSISSSHAMALERIQASVARCVLRASWITAKSALPAKLDWPSLRWRRDIAAVTLLHSLLQDGREPFMNCLFESSKTRSSRKPHQLLLTHASTTKFLNSFFYHSALLWNSLPHSILTITSKPAFRIAVKDNWSTFKYRTDTHVLSV